LYETVFRPVNCSSFVYQSFRWRILLQRMWVPHFRSSGEISGMRQKNMSRVPEYHHAAGALRRTHRHPLLLDPDGERIQLQATKA
ncbi:unnamed protein product, partial [Musa banksii]